MLTLLSGDHRIKIDAVLEKGTRQSRADGTYRRHIGDVDVLEIDPYFSESLFGEVYTVVFDGFSLFPSETQEFIIRRLQDMNSSTHSFYILDGAFGKELENEAKVQKITIEEHALPPKRPTGPNVFSLTDAYLLRDKKNAWLRLMEIYRGGAAPEEVHGALFWAIKSLLLVMSGEGAEELGMKPFVYQKMKHTASAWKLFEVRERLLAITDLLEDSRKTGGDLGAHIEQFVLTT